MKTIENSWIRAVIDENGGELKSLYSLLSNTEYLWQGAPLYWRGQAPNLFPFIGRLYQKKYIYQGQEYEMEMHGFLSHSHMSVRSVSRKEVVLGLRDTPEIRGKYPFHFKFYLRYQLAENTLIISDEIINTGNNTMYFALGAHPGFNVPLENDSSFEDYQIEFGSPCHPQRILFTDQVLVSGEKENYPLEDRRRISLHHSLFANDAIVLENADWEVSLSSKKGKRSLTVECPKMKYIGFWQKMTPTTPYLCIEPWSSLPGRQNIVEDISLMPGLLSLNAGEIYINSWSVSLY